MRHTLYAIAAVLLLSAALLSFGGWAAKQPMKRLRGAGMSTPTAVAPEPAQRHADPPSRRAAPGGCTTGSVSGFAWALGLLFCAIAAAIVVYFLVQGIKYVRPNPVRHQPAVGFTETRRAASSTR